jgi:predicted nuclease of restriction endonuclease-like (RecB) superfamily
LFHVKKYVFAPNNAQKEKLFLLFYGYIHESLYLSAVFGQVPILIIEKLMTAHQDIIKDNSLNVIDSEYVRLVSHISELWENAKEEAIVAVNGSLLMASWATGRHIVEFEQGGKSKANYGDRLLVNLSKDLTRLNGRGFSRSNLTYMRKFYVAFPKSETVSHQLTWSHYFELLKCNDSLEMQFYMTEAIKEGWRVRELKRQIGSSLYERLALSTDKEGILALANEGHVVQKPSDIIKDPYILEFTGLPVRKRYKESELEKALKANMEQFLLELGRGFAFIGRQYVIPIGSRRFKVDLVFYHAILKCYVLIDLKRAEIKHADIGQMNMYLNYFKKEICQPDDNLPIGIVLGAKKDELLMEYALEGISNQLFTARYQLYLPKKEELQAQLNIIIDNQQ